MHKFSSLKLSELIAGKDVFTISNYQRFYVWTEDQVKAFFNDICITNRKQRSDPKYTHFFGQMILREIDEDERDRKTYEIIDGQQRITTLVLLFAVLSKYLGCLLNESPNLSKKIEEEDKECKKYLVSKLEEAVDRNRLSLSAHDEGYFQSIIRALRSNDDVPTPKEQLQSHKALYNAQEVLSNLLDKEFDPEENTKAKLKRITQLRDTVAESFQVVILKPDEEKYTFQLYQVVNDRGQLLTDCELLKAKTMEVLAGNQDATAIAKEIWDNILDDPWSESEGYLKFCYMSKLGKEKKSSEKYFHVFIRDYFDLPTKESYTKTEQKKFISDLKELHKDIEYCRCLSKGVWPIPQNESKCNQWQKNALYALVYRKGHTLCIPVLISALRSKTTHGNTSESNFVRCLEYCETNYSIYKALINERETRFKKIYLEAAKNLRNLSDVDALNKLKNNLFNSEQKGTIRIECEEQLNKITYESDKSTVKYLLFLLETYYSGFVNGHLNPKRVTDGTALVYDELSIEHIYNKNMNGDKVDKALEDVKHHLGNLVLYGCKSNSSLPEDYESKKKYYLSCSLQTAVSVASTYEEWNITNYSLRHVEVCEKLLDILLRFYPKEATKKSDTAK